MSIKKRERERVRERRREGEREGRKEGRWEWNQKLLKCFPKMLNGKESKTREWYNIFFNQKQFRESFCFQNFHFTTLIYKLFYLTTLYMFFKPPTVQKIWIGAQKAASNPMSKVFVWSHSQSAVTYTNWDSGKPDNAGGIEDCIHVFTFHFINIIKLN